MQREITPLVLVACFLTKTTGQPDGRMGNGKGRSPIDPANPLKWLPFATGTSNTIFFSEILGQPSNGDCRGAWGRVACNTFSPHTKSSSDQWIVGPNADTSASTFLYDAPPYCGSSTPVSRVC